VYIADRIEQPDVWRLSL